MPHFPEDVGNSRVSAGGRSSIRSTRSSVSQAIHQHSLRSGTVFGVTFNTLTNVVGAGVLSLPYAMYNGSISISMFLLFLCAGITCFTAYVLTLACDVTDKWSYTEVFAFTAFPDVPLHEQDEHREPEEDIDEGIVLADEPIARRRRRQLTMLMEAVVFFTNFGTVVIYSRVIADSIPPVLTNFFGAHGTWVAEWLWLVGPAVLFFILSCARNMDELKVTSIIGFVTIFYIVVAVIVRYFTNIYDPISPKSQDNEVDSIRWFDVRISMFATLATYALAFGYHFNVCYFYCELKDRRPAVMMETVKISFPIITVMYAATGMLGYLTFGALVADNHASGNIVNNFSDDDVFVNIGRLGLFFHFASVYPILSVCARRGLHRFICLAVARAPTDEEKQLSKKKTRFDPPPGDPSTTRMSSIILEALFIVAGSTIIAAFVPGIGVVVNLIGTLSGFPSVIIIPAYIGTKIFDDRIPCMEGLPNNLLRKLSHVCFWLGNILLICGIASFILGELNIN